jgi:hypothetical protein
MSHLEIRITPHEVVESKGQLCMHYPSSVVSGYALDAILEGLSDLAYRDPAILLEAMTDPHTAPFDLLNVCRDALRVLPLKGDDEPGVVESDEEFAGRMRRTGQQGGEVRKWAGNFLLGNQHAVCDASEVGG